MDRASILRNLLTNPESEIDTRVKEDKPAEGPGSRIRRSLAFSRNGICLIRLEGLPKPYEIEAIIEDYVAQVELLPYQLKVIILDISELVHLQAPSRKLFSELLVQASKRYGEKVQLLVAGGPTMIRKYTEIFCRALKFDKETICFETINEARQWLKGGYSDEA